MATRWRSFYANKGIQSINEDLAIFTAQNMLQEGGLEAGRDIDMGINVNSSSENRIPLPLLIEKALRMATNRGAGLNLSECLIRPNELIQMDGGVKIDQEMYVLDESITQAIDHIVHYLSIALGLIDIWKTSIDNEILTPMIDNDLIDKKRHQLENHLLYVWSWAIQAQEELWIDVAVNSLYQGDEITPSFSGEQVEGIGEGVIGGGLSVGDGDEKKLQSTILYRLACNCHQSITMGYLLNNDLFPRPNPMSENGRNSLLTAIIEKSNVLNGQTLQSLPQTVDNSVVRNRVEYLIKVLLSSATNKVESM